MDPHPPSFLGSPRSPPHPRFARVRWLATLPGQALKFASSLAAHFPFNLNLNLNTLLPLLTLTLFFPLSLSSFFFSFLTLLLYFLFSFFYFYFSFFPSLLFSFLLLSLPFFTYPLNLSSSLFLQFSYF